MFTGLVEDVGRVVGLMRTSTTMRITVEAPKIGEFCAVGDSVAVNGVCLTVVDRHHFRLTFDAVSETRSRTSFRLMQRGASVNLERAVQVGQRLGGHFVLGHVDAAGPIQSIAGNETAKVVRVGLTPELMKYMLPKGSVAVDGISLTVVDVGPDFFTVWIIPHTFKNTAMRERRVNDLVNIEVDMLGKYVERLLAHRGLLPGITPESLEAAGFADDV